MFKFSSIFLVLFLLKTGLCDEIVEVTDDHNSNDTMSSNPQMNRAFINTDLTNHNLTMFSRKENNLIVNSSGSVVGMSRNASFNTAASSSTLIVILISLVVVSCIIAIIVTALFVMRRRFTIWRLNGSKSNECSDGANGVLTNTSSENESMNKCEAAMETKTEADNQNQPAIEEKKDEIKTQNLPEQTSATSLIVNVLNELSESVACKLANTPSKSNNNLVENDQEKQPLKTNEEN